MQRNDAKNTHAAGGEQAGGKQSYLVFRSIDIPTIKPPSGLAALAYPACP